MITVAGGIVKKGDKILVAQRHRNDSHGFKWEFPGGTLNPGECGEDGVKRELMEELGIEVEVENYFSSYTEPPFKILYYVVRYLSGEIRLTEHEQIQWVSRDQILEYDMLPGDRIIAERFRSI
ncbi:NUDIX domain-containing protein [Candidatus Bathyarchaeota archaeon]|nr:NUDIX domain-containing protein [Candidatus Bathyarchaeota archaeon]